MALIDEAYIRATFQIHKDVLPSRLTPYLAVADRRVKKWVGAVHYADANLLEILELAEGLLVMHYLQLNLNTNVRPKGLVKAERAEGDTVIQFLSPQETEKSAQMFLEQAEEILRDVTDYAPEDGFEIVIDEIIPGKFPNQWLT